MRFSFVLSILGQTFALASEPDEPEVSEALSVGSDLAFGFATTEATEWVEEEEE